MIEGINFIGYSTSKLGSDVLQAQQPEKNELLDEPFYIATEEEIDEALVKAASAFEEYKHYSGAQKAAFLDVIGEEIMKLGDELIKRASKETGLTHGRLEGERGRTVNQLNMFAELLREGSWVDARIDSSSAEGQPDVRRMLFPLGPVAVFGASNFPLAFSTAGGDTASALAAGCPVIVKAHESHPGTNELVSRAILEAAKETNMPDGVFSSLNGGPEVGSKLVQHPGIKAVGFTGSFGGGKAIYDLAQQRDEPIPVYAEMGSINPVFLLDEKLQTEGKNLAEELAGSVTLATGQFCTNPGLIIAKQGDGLDAFKEALAKKLDEEPPGCMLNPGIAENYRKKRAEAFSLAGIDVLAESDGESETTGTAAVATVAASDFLSGEDYQEEVFGPFTLVVSCENDDEMQEVARKLKGQLTVSFMGMDDDLANQDTLVSISREKAGRVIFNGVPTGVRVGPAMQHGGPFPATTDSRSTSVGTAAIQRFVRPIAFQDWPDALLPDELKDENPLGILRIYDGSYKR